MLTAKESRRSRRKKNPKRRKRTHLRAAAPRRRRRNPLKTQRQIARYIKKHKVKPRRRKSGQFTEARSRRRGRRRTSETMVRARHRRYGRRARARQNPMVGGEMFAALLTGTVGYLLTDFLDRMIASHSAKEGGSPQANAAVINGSLGWVRGLSQLGVSAGTFLIANYVRSPMAKASLQGLGFGSALHLAVQGGRMLAYKFFLEKGKPEDPMVYEYYPDLKYDTELAKPIVEGAKSSANPYGTGSGTTAGLPHGLGRIGARHYYVPLSPYAHLPAQPGAGPGSVVTTGIGPGTVVTTGITPGGVPTTTFTPPGGGASTTTFSPPGAPGTTFYPPGGPGSAYYPPGVPGTEYYPPGVPGTEYYSPYGPPGYGYGPPYSGGYGGDCSGSPFPCPPVLSANTAAQMAQMTYGAALKEASNGMRGGCQPGLAGRPTFEFRE